VIEGLWRIARFLSCVSVMLLIGVTAISDVSLFAFAGQEFHYDPTSCKTDAHGKIYIALGGDVLTLPATGNVIIARYGKNWLTPPDPKEPPGCPDNPEQLTGYGFPYAYNAALGRANPTFPNNTQFGVDVLQLIGIRGPSSAASGDTEWNGETYQIGLARTICAPPDVRRRNEGMTVTYEELSDGFDACRVKDGDIKRVEDMRTTYIARPDVYQTPLGRKFIVNCGWYLYEDATDDCSVSYVFRPGLGITYQFRPYHGSPQILPVDQVIPFDRGLRAAVNQALIPDYPWPPPREGRPTRGR